MTMSVSTPVIGGSWTVTLTNDCGIASTAPTARVTWMKIYLFIPRAGPDGLEIIKGSSPSFATGPISLTGTVQLRIPEEVEGGGGSVCHSLFHPP